MSEKMIGVYKIENLITGKYYVGSSNNIKRRWREHLNQLNNNKHHNLYLQNSWNKYGQENFKFEIIEQINNEKILKEIEEKWIFNLKSFEREFGYNISVYTYSPLRGVKLREETIIKLKNKNISEQHKLNISRAKKGKKLTKEHKNKISDGLTGRVYSSEAKKNMSKAQRGENHPNNKLTKNDVILIKKLIKEGLSNVKIAEMFKVTHQMISAIKTGKRWFYVTEKDLQVVG